MEVVGTAVGARVGERSACGMHSAGSDVTIATLVRSSVCGTG